MNALEIGRGRQRAKVRKNRLQSAGILDTESRYHRTFIFAEFAKCGAGERKLQRLLHLVGSDPPDRTI